MVDTQAGHDPGSHEAQHRCVRGREDLGILDPHPRQLVDVEEPAVAAGLRVDVEEPGALLLVGPEGVQLVDGHVVGHDVEDHADPGRGQRLERRLPPRSVETCVGSTTSYPCVEPLRAWSTGDR